MALGIEIIYICNNQCQEWSTIEPFHWKDPFESLKYNIPTAFEQKYFTFQTMHPLTKCMQVWC